MQGNLFEAPEKPVVILRCSDYRSIIAKFKDTSDAFIYCDPPYKMDTRRDSRRLYLFDWKADSEHTEFLALMNTATCSVMISAYECEMYNELLAGWNTHRFPAMTRAEGCVKKLFTTTIQNPKCCTIFNTSETIIESGNASKEKCYALKRNSTACQRWNAQQFYQTL